MGGAELPAPGGPQSLVSLLLEEATPREAGAPNGEGGGGHLPLPRPALTPGLAPPPP